MCPNPLPEGPHPSPPGLLQQPCMELTCLSDPRGVTPGRALGSLLLMTTPVPGAQGRRLAAGDTGKG